MLIRLCSISSRKVLRLQALLLKARLWSWATAGMSRGSIGRRRSPCSVTGWSSLGYRTWCGVLREIRRGTQQRLLE